MREVIASGSQASYLPSGHLIYRVGNGPDSELHAAAFDIDRFVIKGASIVVSDQIFAIESAGGGFFTVAETGHLAYLPTGTILSTTSLLWVEKDGASTVLDIDPGSVSTSQPFPRRTPPCGRQPRRWIVGPRYLVLRRADRVAHTFHRSRSQCISRLDAGRRATRV